MNPSLLAYLALQNRVLVSVGGRSPDEVARWAIENHFRRLGDCDGDGVPIEAMATELAILLRPQTA